jgi:hypothetical protein
MHTGREVGRGDCPVEKTIFTIFRIDIIIIPWVFGTFFGI